MAEEKSNEQYVTHETIRKIVREEIERFVREKEAEKQQRLNLQRTIKRIDDSVDGGRVMDVYGE